ncbi:hypothetical protein LEP1GSC050_4088 [Leptospira broomii serovar Hurstbridge str. 5399]|uniref:Uncharacterized protein n=1 Tax=Leptospira broomii serovar Hurstbridge str. 5399 TaxID=1049789 RepID=T0F2Q5_9LEPT|nr:hypothetical protein LEP1GSC050_4088 [Leptospira broomii serovar Hurstbridge str. 5399]
MDKIEPFISEEIAGIFWEKSLFGGEVWPPARICIHRAQNSAEFPESEEASWPSMK